MAIDELRRDSLHRMLREPPGAGRAHLADTVPDTGPTEYFAAVASAAYGQPNVQRGHGEYPG